MNLSPTPSEQGGSGSGMRNEQEPFLDMLCRLARSKDCMGFPIRKKTNSSVVLLCVINDREQNRKQAEAETLQVRKDECETR